MGIGIHCLFKADPRFYFLVVREVTGVLYLFDYRCRSSCPFNLELFDRKRLAEAGKHCHGDCAPAAAGVFD